MSDSVVETSAVSETSVDDIARELTSRRDQGQRTVLFLGSRAGGFFGNEFLYETLKHFSLKNFDTLSRVDKFGECHTVLNKHFKEGDRHHILADAQARLTYREEDRLLAELVKAGFFEVIISTNIDTLLENAYSACGLLPNDYRVFIAGSEDIAGIEYDKARYSDIVKVFGDLNSRRYNITGDLKADASLRRFLESKLGGDVFMVGYDPVWDRGIEQAFPLKGKTVWYVNETALSPNTHVAHVLEERSSKLFQNNRGSYRSFIKILYDSLSKELSRNEVTSLQPQSPIKDKKTVFISYSSKDEKYMDRLQTHLKGYLYLLKDTYKDTVTVWDETKIQPGDPWREEIKKALMQAEVAILLISAPNLSSPSVHTDELSLIQDVALKENVKVLPIILDQSSLSRVNHEMLDQYRVLNNSAKPLKKMKPYDREVVWDKLAEQVYSILDTSSS